MSLLEGVRIIELASERISFAGKLLADLGADLILIEPPEGDPSRGYPPYLDDQPGANRSLYFWHYNTSKRGVTLALDREPDRFKQLMRTADILIESEPIQRLASLKLDFHDLQAIKPDLIHVAVTPYGRNEQLSDYPATDLTLMAAGGPPWSCGYDDHSLPPSRGWGNQAYHTASHFAVMSILTALLHRGTTGEGQFIDVSITAALNVTTEAASYSWLVAGSTVQRQTGRHATPGSSGETQVQCADGKWVNTGVPPRVPREFGKLLNWLAKLELVDQLPEAVFLEMGAAWEGPFDLSLIGTDDTVTAIFGSGREALRLIAANTSAYEFFTGCQSNGLAVGIINSPEEAFEDPHFKARGFHATVEHEDFDMTVTYPGAPYNLPKAPWRISRRAPHLGEHNDEVFHSLES
jgi:crotonobetainyl-CoA:carnitine CoA-transferase CaiB-like acyl-CoA transferase